MDEFINSKGLKLGGVETKNKNKNALFLFHGFGGNYMELDNIFGFISDYFCSSYDIYRFSYSGNFGSEGDFVDFTIEDFINDAMDLVKAKQKEYKKISILGLSMGSLITSHLTYLLPENILKKLKKVVLLSPVNSIAGLAFTSFESLLKGKNNFGDIKEADFIKGEKISKDFVINALRWIVSDKIKNFGGDVLVLQPESDIDKNFALSSFYVNNYKNSRYLLVKGADHCWTKIKDRKALINELDLFLK